MAPFERQSELRVGHEAREDILNHRLAIGAVQDARDGGVDGAEVLSIAGLHHFATSFAKAHQPYVSFEQVDCCFGSGSHRQHYTRGEYV